MFCAFAFPGSRNVLILLFGWTRWCHETHPMSRTDEPQLDFQDVSSSRWQYVLSKGADQLRLGPVWFLLIPATSTFY